MLPFFRYKISLKFSIILYFVFLFYCYFVMAEKTLFSFQTLLKGTFSLLTCHLQTLNRVSMTIKRQSVRSLSDHKTARSFCVSQQRGIVERMVWSKTKWSFPLIWSRGVGWGCWRVSETGERSKNTPKNTMETDKENIKERKK